MHPMSKTSEGEVMSRTDDILEGLRKPTWKIPGGTIMKSAYTRKQVIKKVEEGIAEIKTMSNKVPKYRQYYRIGMKDILLDVRQWLTQKRRS